jgi:hypothetical protein
MDAAIQEKVDYSQVLWTRRIRMMPVDDFIHSIQAIISDWGADVLSANTTSAGLVLADLVYYAGIDAVEALGAELTEELRKRGVL